jgi:hypothetical protein
MDKTPMYSIISYGLCIVFLNNKWNQKHFSHSLHRLPVHILSKFIYIMTFSDQIKP